MKDPKLLFLVEYVAFEQGAGIHGKFPAPVLTDMQPKTIADAELRLPSAKADKKG